MFGPNIVRLGALGYAAIGIGWYACRIQGQAKLHKAAYWPEFFLSFRAASEVQFTIIFWHFDMIVSLVSLLTKHKRTFRRAIQDDIFDEIVEEQGRVKDWTYKVSVECLQNSVKTAEKDVERLREASDEAILKVRTTGAIGATAMTMATATVNATAATVSTNAPSEVKLTTSGWVATETHTTFGDSPKTFLEYARVRLSLDDTRLHAGVYTEVDGDQLQYHDGNWLAQSYLYFKPNDAVTIRAGRLFVAAGWCTPAPHSVETVNYTRVPFSFTAYGVQGDVTHGPWHMLGDITGDSSLTFADPGQFNRIEGSGRVEYTINPRYTLALTGQSSKDFARAAFDVSLNPTPWASMRAMVYGDAERATHTVGNSFFAGIHPLKTVQNLELHGQVDALVGVGCPTTEPAILTGGVRMLFKDGKYSVTADFQHGLGEKHPDSSDGFYLRLQERF